MAALLMGLAGAVDEWSRMKTNDEDGGERETERERTRRCAQLAPIQKISRPGPTRALPRIEVSPVGEPSFLPCTEQFTGLISRLVVCLSG